MVRIAGVLTLVAALYVALYFADAKRNSFKTTNLIDVTNRQGQFGVITLGVAVLIVTGAIDLSIGSVVGLSAVGFVLLTINGVPPIAATLLVLLGGMSIGLLHGVLVTRFKLQSFLVTLCGLFVYRGLARYFTKQQVGLVGLKTEHPETTDSVNFLRSILIGKDGDGVLHYPAQMFVLLFLALIVGLVLHRSVIGRYWYAIGYNESAARYSGIATDRYRLFGFVISSMLASLGGIMLLLDTGTADPNTAGESWELYAITGAVLGGCSLKGGEGTAIGIVLGAMVLPLLKSVVSFLEIPDSIIPAVIGLTLLFGTLADEFFRRRSAVRK
ncbi:MAG TPA: ABC transporter permease [Gemmataceae bacterium]|jgi:ribose transport system permease protein|nr:ABC transporter permease [Gemmataceae bacterium]